MLYNVDQNGNCYYWPLPLVTGYHEPVFSNLLYLVISFIIIVIIIIIITIIVIITTIISIVIIIIISLC